MHRYCTKACIFVCTKKSYLATRVFGPDCVEVDWPGRRAGSFAEIGIKLIIYAENCLGKRAHTAESTYVILAWHAEGILE